MDTAQRFFSVRVVEKIFRHGVIIFTLAQRDGAPLPLFTAGAHLSLRLPDGLIRQYSLCGDAGQPERYRLAILVAPDAQGAGVYLRDSLTVGTSVQISAPRNDFPLADRPSPSLLLAGGIGITPLLSMAQTLRTQRRQFQLHYFGRHDTLAAFVDQPEYAAVQDYLVVHSRDQDIATQLPPLVTDWQQRYGRFGLYYCGSLPFMQSVREYCDAQGFPQADGHYESFTPAPVRGEPTFDIEIFSTGEIIPVTADLTIAGALHQAGIEVEISCGLGICGTCLAEVKDGIPDHRDDYLSVEQKQANNQILLCCSRAKTPRLVIDL
ncbi:PDR/VanB family oxidoreductase [Acerihabitans sp. TG2]|uniref:PDR/VanB family oxidoreductase n=1 Tax=Acerihabitans sp. TG2 TaxID=3096008 RepID=UPI002B22EBC7|nr:PDR/VanB family oxidoreductase [Acerihabitans sp. TG2]MEA9391406.1 PDR/VanB family oxidoreductase [Acerihabitans sp. TG2]